MYAFSRAAELDLLGFSILHVLNGMDERDAFLTGLYKGVLEIVIEVVNDPSHETLQDKLDRVLQETDISVDVKMSIFDYVLGLIERVVVHFRMMGVINEVKYRLEMKNETLMVGTDKIMIDFPATYFEMDRVLKETVAAAAGVPWKDDVIDNPTSDDLVEATDLDHTVGELVKDHIKPQLVHWKGDEVIDNTPDE